LRKESSLKDFFLKIQNKDIYVHLLSGVGIALSAAFFQNAYQNYRIDRELVTWDYVKKHPSDFPEVFNRKLIVFDCLNFFSEFQN